MSIFSFISSRRYSKMSDKQRRNYDRRYYAKKRAKTKKVANRARARFKKMGLKSPY